MPPVEEVNRSLYASWRMMLGHRDALRMHDLSADGFWNSFFAIAVAVPALVVGWVAIADDLAANPTLFASRLSVVVRLALVDLSSWIVPLVLLAFVAPYARMRDRFVHYVVATNWGSAIFVWMMLPPALLRLVFPGAGQGVTLLSVIIFLVTLVLGWRLTNAALERGPAVATAVFSGMLFASLVVLFTLQALLGLSP